jgi:UDP-N-acetylmuramoylalanine--D-glutamate ligase
MGSTPSPTLDTSIQRVTVMGLGRFGGGLGVAQWWLDHGAHVLVTDQARAESLHEPVTRLKAHPKAERLRFHLGEHQESDFTDTDLVIANPAVPRPWDNPYLQAAWAAGIPVTTEIALATAHLDRRKVIGITGTAGKSTTAAMAHHLLKSCTLRSVLAGNIGGSLLSNMDEAEAADVVVLELSSAMLWWLGATDDAPPDAPNWSPSIAVTTNVEPNHLDWHGDQEHYRRCKAGISRHQHDGDHVVYDVDATDPLPLAVPGRHNQWNAHLALAAAMCLDSIDRSEAIAALSTFPGLPHRLERIDVTGANLFFNDSKSTTPGATALAIDAMPDARRVHLIIGGYDKGIALNALVDCSRSIAGVYTIGATGPALAADTGGSDCGTLEAAVACALSRMQDGDALLLSPGCASWDQYDNYEQRGDRFKATVQSLTSSP